MADLSTQTKKILSSALSLIQFLYFFFGRFALLLHQKHVTGQLAEKGDWQTSNKP
jgi:hypothetical protein